VAKAGFESIKNVLPRGCVRGCILMGRHPLLQDLPLPFLQRNLVRRCGNVIPRGLRVVDLLTDRDISKPGWWHRQRATHRERAYHAAGNLPIT
jgi:hypothetical protein